MTTKQKSFEPYKKKKKVMYAFPMHFQIYKNDNAGYIYIIQDSTSDVVPIQQALYVQIRK